MLTACAEVELNAVHISEQFWQGVTTFCRGKKWNGGSNNTVWYVAESWGGAWDQGCAGLCTA